MLYMALTLAFAKKNSIYLHVRSVIFQSRGPSELKDLLYSEDHKKLIADEDEGREELHVKSEATVG